MKAIILSIGDELILGQTVDTNAAYLSQNLVNLGFGIKYHHTIDDSMQDIIDAIQAATKQAPLVLITGGLGPTPDDLTRQALAKAMNVDLQIHQGALETLEAWFTSYSREMSPNNTIQAMMPTGANPIPNSCGTAPGIHATLNDAQIYIMPGVPREMRAMMQDIILPNIKQQFPDLQDKHILTHKINTYGHGESRISQTLGKLLDRDRNPIVGTTVANGIVSIRIRSEFTTQEETQTKLEQTIIQVSGSLGDIVFGDNDQSLAQVTVQALAQANLTLATAESCTGGMLSQFITDISGSSKIFLGGFVTYADQMKIEQLGLDPALIEKHGVVSAPVAQAMAQGALNKTNADLAISITGIAGPEGGSPEKPIGTVHVALASKDNPTQSYHFQFKGSRQLIRHRTAMSCLQILRYKALGIPDTDLFWQKKD